MTLIGNRRGLAFELAPVTPSWERRYGPEAAAWAGLSIWAGNENLCRHVVPGSSEIQDRLFVPLGPIADWLVAVFPALRFEERAAVFPTSRRLPEDLARWGGTPSPSGIDEDAWLDEREGWWSRHFMRAGADGAQIPNLSLVREDEELALAWTAPRFAASDAPMLLSPSGDFALPWREGCAVLNEFVARVAEWLREAGAADAFWWGSEPRPLEASDTSLSSRLELFTGRPLGELEALFGVQGLEQVLARVHLPSTAGDPAESTQCQILRDLSPRVTSDVGPLLAELGARTSHREAEAIGRWRRSREVAHDAARAFASPVERGQAAALALRQALGLEADPVPAGIGALLGSLGLRYDHSEADGGRDRMIVGLGEGGSPSAVTLKTLRTEKQWAQRFEAARALGHVALDPIRAETIGAASGPYARASRGQRSGAFSAEFLLPERAIARASSDQLDGAADAGVFGRLLEEYGVGAQTGAWQLWNRGWLSSPVIRDELMVQFAAA